MVNAVVLLTHGDIKDINLIIKDSQKSFEISQIINDSLVKKYLTNMGKSKIKLLETWNINEELILAYGYTDGKIENNHELPPSSNTSESIYYGDILVVKTNKNILVSFMSEDYELVYNTLFGNISDEEDDLSSEYNSEYSDEEDDEELDTEDNNIDEDVTNKAEDDIESNEDSNIYDSNLENFPKKKKIKIISKKKKKWDTDEEVDDNYHVIDTNGTQLDVENQIDESVSIRDEIITIFNNIINNIEISKKIENSVFEYTNKMCEKENIIKRWENMFYKKIYMNKVRSLYSNINSDTYVENTNFITKINNSEFDLNNIANMSYQAIYPEHWKILMDIKYNKEKLLFENKQEAMTDQFKCGRCKSRKCTYY